MTYLYDTVKTSARIARQGAATSTVAISPALRGAALPKLPLRPLRITISTWCAVARRFVTHPSVECVTDRPSAETIVLMKALASSTAPAANQCMSQFALHVVAASQCAPPIINCAA
jgi:hypothetical protein